MSELSTKIRALRGEQSAEDAARKVGLSRESFYRIERGGSVKLATLRQIATGFRMARSEWLELLVAWLRTEAGDDVASLWIESKAATPSALRDTEADQVARAALLFRQLNTADRQEISKAMARPEVRACLPAINRVWEKFGPERSEHSSSPTTHRRVEIAREGIAALERDLAEHREQKK